MALKESVQQQEDQAQEAEEAETEEEMLKKALAMSTAGVKQQEIMQG